MSKKENTLDARKEFNFLNLVICFVLCDILSILVVYRKLKYKLKINMLYPLLASFFNRHTSLTIFFENHPALPFTHNCTTVHRI